MSDLRLNFANIRLDITICNSLKQTKTNTSLTLQSSTQIFTPDQAVFACTKFSLINIELIAHYMWLGGPILTSRLMLEGF